MAWTWRWRRAPARGWRPSPAWRWGRIYGADHSWGPEVLLGYKGVANESLGDTTARFVAGGDAFTLRADQLSGQARPPTSR